MKVMRAAISILLVSACSHAPERSIDPDSRDRVAIDVLPRLAVELSNARYTITVTARGAALWSRTLDAGRGLARLDGPCDPSPDAQPNLVTLVLEGLEVGGVELPPDTWRNPTPIVFPIDCRAGTTTLVPFDLPIATGTIKGSVTLDDVFCAAKLDCREAFLDPIGPADVTAVLGFACTAGPGEETTLYMNDIRLTCDGLPTVVINPALVGQRSVASDVVFTTGTYTGRGADPELDLCFWNTSLGLTLSSDGSPPNPRNCRLTARGAAAAGGVGTLPGGATPALVRYPVIAWDVPLTDQDGQLVCGAHPLNGADGYVSVDYTDLQGETFRWPYECGDRPKLTCQGRTSTVDGASILVDDLGDGAVRLAIDGAVKTLQLPEGVTLDTDVGCCISPCCDLGPLAP